MAGTTTLRVRLTTKALLDAFGGKSDTYDDILYRMARRLGRRKRGR